MTTSDDGPLGGPPTSRESSWEGLPRSHHIGLVVNSCSRTLNFFRECGFAIGRPRNDLYRADNGAKEVVFELKVAFVDDGSTLLEVIEPTDAASPHAAYLRDRGEGLHHVAYVVHDVVRETSRLGERGLRVTWDATATPDTSKWLYLADANGAAPVMELIEESSYWQAFVSDLPHRYPAGPL